MIHRSRGRHCHGPIRVLNENLAYASGKRVYKYTADAVSRRDHDRRPTAFVLYQNYPNPFNPSTEIRFDIPEASFVRLEVFDAVGRSAGVLINALLTAGSHVGTWNAADFPSGVYTVRLDAGSRSTARPIVLAK